MLTVYRRHLKTCEHRNEGRAYRRCHCPMWVDGFLHTAEIRESLGLRDWEKAQEKIREWEAGVPVKETEHPTIEQACREFPEDAAVRNLRDPTLYKYRLLFRDLKAYAGNMGLRFITEFDLPTVRKFRASWPDGNLSALKKLERLRAFFRFAQEGGWIADNPAAKLKNPIVTQPPTMPFTREEVIAIPVACENYPDNYGRLGQSNAKRLRALTLLLRYSGLRIRDAATLAEDRVVGNKLFLYTAKTGTPVWCPLPDFVIEALDSCPRTNARCFFRSGESDPKSAVGDWPRSLPKLFKLAGVDNGDAHRFRDTFAVELLLSGVPLERVSVLLGHRSLKVTEKHYAPWVKARQEQPEADVKRSWGEDPVALLATKGTPEVHGGKRAVQ